MNESNFVDIEGVGVPVVFDWWALTSASILSAMSYVEQTPRVWRFGLERNDTSLFNFVNWQPT